MLLAATDKGDAMRGLFLPVLILAAMGSAAGAAHAQPGLSSAPNLDGADNANRIAENARRKLDAIRKDGLEALQKQDYAAAEQTFGKLLAQNPTTTDANYLMALAKMGQQNWPEAKEFLENAVKQEPKWPDPKARLGIAYLRLNDTGSAAKQRAELAGLASKCNGCPDAARIADNLALLDRAIAAQKPKADPAN
jgi:TolA-binding protein